MRTLVAHRLRWETTTGLRAEELNSFIDVMCKEEEQEALAAAHMKLMVASTGNRMIERIRVISDYILKEKFASC